MITNTLMAGPALTLALRAQRFAQRLTSSAAEPAAATPRSRYKEAEALREYANRFVKTDPGFASDLYAAADRHENIVDAGH